MELAGVSQLALQLMDGMEKNIRPLMVNAFPPGAYREQLIDLFFAKFHQKATPKQILDLAVPVYDKYYSDEDIKGLIGFISRRWEKAGRNAAKTLSTDSRGSEDMGRECGERLNDGGACGASRVGRSDKGGSETFAAAGIDGAIVKLEG